MFHHTRVLIDPGAYKHNLQVLSSSLRPGCKVCAVLKADGYGHGIEWLAPVANALGVEAIAITENWEAETVRRLGFSRRVIRLRPAAMEEVKEAMAWKVEETTGTLEQAREYSRLGIQQKQPVPIHLKLDVGMGRAGLSRQGQEKSFRQIRDLPGILITGIMTHFPCADEDDLAITESQLDEFERCSQNVAALLPNETVIHAANSAAMMRLPSSHMKMVRLGIASYGLAPCPTDDPQPELRPVMQIVSEIVQVRMVHPGETVGYGMTWRANRETYTATLPIGYANGYLRDFTNRASVLIHGKRCPVVGRISMNMVTVDVTELNDVRIGEEAVILGKQGEETIRADELADWANTIHYEITCLLGACNRNSRILNYSQDHFDIQES